MLSIYNWKDISGKVIVEQNGHEFTFNLYGEGKCNAFLTTVFETESEYQLQWFFMDESHGKRMLGLAKLSDGTKENCLPEVRKLILYRKQCDNWQKILTMFAKAYDHIDIEIWNDKEGE